MTQIIVLAQLDFNNVKAWLGSVEVDKITIRNTPDAAFYTDFLLNIKVDSTGAEKSSPQFKNGFFEIGFACVAYGMKGFILRPEHARVLCL